MSSLQPLCADYSDYNKPFLLFTTDCRGQRHGARWCGESRKPTARARCEPRKLGYDACESRCPAHGSLDHAPSITRNEFNHVVLTCRSEQNCTHLKVIRSLGITNDLLYAETPEWLISQSRRIAGFRRSQIVFDRYKKKTNADTRGSIGAHDNLAANVFYLLYLLFSLPSRETMPERTSELWNCSGVMPLTRLAIEAVNSAVVS